MRSIPALDAFQLHLTPFNSTPTFARMERPEDSPPPPPPPKRAGGRSRTPVSTRRWRRCGRPRGWLRAWTSRGTSARCNRAPRRKRGRDARERRNGIL
eukprot:813-Pelagococcus_subviridis.AAC.1